ncbi:MAG: TonB-dependent receptor [Bacteroidales bacterium]
MRKFVLKSLFLLVPSAFMTPEAMAQYLIKGKLVDAETNETLIGATAIIEGTTIGAATDFDGLFELNSPSNGNVKLIFRNVGYDEVKKAVKVTTATTNLGTISLNPTSVGLDNVTVIASVVRADRQTPIAVSNIKLEVLEEKLGNQEFPEVLKQTPSVYATKSGGGYGDSRINMRGFDTNNIGVLVNGVPVNDMENGKVYWSNWAGLSDVTQFMQVQRGLGASKLGLSSAGGTINIITKTTEAKKGVSASVGMGNDGMNKFSLALSTGLMDNGWSITALGARNAADGYIQGTNYVGYTYFLNVSKMINDAHRISFTGFGAPQWHNKRGVMHTVEDWKTKPGQEKYNATMGFYQGEITGGPYGYNEYHKPQFSLNHSWNINEKSSLNTALYASISSGGGREAQGANSNWLTWNNNTGRPNTDKDGNQTTKLTPDGYLDFDAVVAANKEAGNSGAVLVIAENRHQWYGILSSYNNQLTENLNITAGYDGRYYRGYHYQAVDDLLGGTGYVESRPLYGREQGTVLQVGDKTNFDNIGEVLWQGVFGQAEYVNDQLSAFLSTSITYQGYRYHALDKAPVNGSQASEMQSFLPWSAKAGFNWKFNENHNVYVNGGMFTRAPYFNNVFKNYTTTPYEDTPYEKIYTVEGGYTFRLPNFITTVNGYFTQWDDRGKSVRVGNDRAILRGLDARHAGVEIETTYNPVKNVELKGMFSYGDWIYTDNVSASLFNENQESLGEYNAYIKDVHVGNSAQMTAALMGSWEIIKGLKVGADWSFFGKNYADFNIDNRKNEGDNYDSYKIPNYSTIDMNASYRLKLNNGVNISFFTNVNNLLNKKYIADAKDATVDGQKTALVYYGFGTTWSAGMKVSF